MDSVRAEEILKENIIVPCSILKDLSGRAIDFYIKMLYQVQNGHDTFPSREVLVQFVLDSGILRERATAFIIVDELMEVGYLKHLVSDNGDEFFMTYGPKSDFERCVCGKLPEHYKE